MTVSDQRNRIVISSLIAAGMVLLYVGWGHLEQQSLQDLPSEDVDRILETPIAQGDAVTNATYQAYHDANVADGVHRLIGTGYVLGGLLLSVGSIALMRDRIGLGVLIGGIGAVSSQAIAAVGHARQATNAEELLDGTLIQTTGMNVWLDVIKGGICLGIALLPISVLWGLEPHLAIVNEEE